MAFSDELARALDLREAHLKDAVVLGMSDMSYWRLCGQVDMIKEVRRMIDEVRRAKASEVENA